MKQSIETNCVERGWLKSRLKVYSGQIDCTDSFRFPVKMGSLLLHHVPCGIYRSVALLQHCAIDYVMLRQLVEQMFQLLGFVLGLCLKKAKVTMDS
jgi:hypothetical protein